MNQALEQDEEFEDVLPFPEDENDKIENEMILKVNHSGWIFFENSYRWK